MAEPLECIYATGCSHPPFYYLLCGCYNLHVTEGPICFTHFERWLDQMLRHNLACPHCGHKIEAYELISTAVLQ